MHMVFQECVVWNELVSFLFLFFHFRFQIMSQYKLNDHFRALLKDCKDVTQEAYPHLFANTIQGRKNKNVSKMTFQWQRLMILFLVHLHYSVHVHNFLYSPKKEFNIKTFPQLGKCFGELEASQETDLAKKSPAKIKSADMDIDLLVTECKQRVKNLKQVSKNYQKEKEKLDHNVAEMEKLLGQIAKQQQKNKDPFPTELLESHVKRIVEEMGKNKKPTTEDDVFDSVVYDEEE